MFGVRLLLTILNHHFLLTLAVKLIMGTALFLFLLERLAVGQHQATNKIGLYLLCYMHIVVSLLPKSCEAPQKYDSENKCNLHRELPKHT